MRPNRTGHLDDGTLHAYLDGELDAVARRPREVREHLERCEACAEKLAAESALRDEAAAILASANWKVEVPPLEELRRRAELGPTPSASAEKRGPAMRFAWAASLAAALGAGWMLGGGGDEGERATALAVNLPQVGADPAEASGDPGDLGGKTMELSAAFGNEAAGPDGIGSGGRADPARGRLVEPKTTTLEETASALRDEPDAPDEPDEEASPAGEVVDEELTSRSVPAMAVVDAEPGAPGADPEIAAGAREIVLPELPTFADEPTPADQAPIIHRRNPLNPAALELRPIGPDPGRTARGLPLYTMEARRALAQASPNEADPCVEPQDPNPPDPSSRRAMSRISAPSLSGRSSRPGALGRAAASVAVSAAIACQPGSDAAVLDEVASTITETDFAYRVGVIAHDSMSGRDTPSPGLEATAAWIASEFAAMGIRGGAEDGGYIQRYPLQRIPVAGTDTLDDGSVPARIAYFPLRDDPGPDVDAGELVRVPNVIGIVPGSDPELADEYVVYSAHMDHVGTGTADASGDSIYNGADDDASGTVAVMEIAQAIAALPRAPRRSSLFILVSGEEKGLWGSAWFSENPTVPTESMVANLNADMVGRNWTDTIVAIGKEHSDLGQTLERVGAAHPELGMTPIDDLWPEQNFYCRSDHYHFARKGVPILFFFNGTHEDYHGRDDEPDRIDAEKGARLARLIFYLGVEIANADERPAWTPGTDIDQLCRR